MSDTLVVPAIRARHRRPGWWRRNALEIVLVLVVAPLGLGGGWWVAAELQAKNPGFVPYASGPLAPVSLGPGHPTMTVEANTARPVFAVAAPTTAARYSRPTLRPLVAVTVAVTPTAIAANIKAAAAPGLAASRGPSPTTTAAPPSNSIRASSTGAPPTSDPATTATTGPPATPAPTTN